jgi:sugar phosphate isomerase/epimerase
MSKIGFATGVLHKTIFPVSKKIIEINKNLGCDAIEISCNISERISFLDKINISDLKCFKYVSLHAPVRNIKYCNDKKTKEILQKIDQAYKRLKINYVVIHPDLVEDWGVFKNYSFKIAIENMDWRKDSYKNIKDIRKVVKKINCKMVLDINHCYTNDKTLKLAKDFWKNFKDIICGIHLSGFTEFHDPLFKTKQVEILKAVPKKNIPIIIESMCKNKNEMKKELEYIKIFLSK